MQQLRRLAPALALLLLALLGCNRGLWTPDEPREAEIGREMLLMPGVLPRLDGHPFLEKPPLYYWTLAAAYRLGGGPSALAARAVSVAAGAATLALLYRWTLLACAGAAAPAVVLMLATSLEFLVAWHWVLLDPLLMLATTAAAWAAWSLLTGPALHPWRRRCALYGALTVALWIKGPIGPLLIAAGLLCYLLIERPTDGWRRLWPLGGTLWLLLMFAALAFALAARGGGAALREWLYVNQVQRLLHPGATGHRQPWLYYVWTLPLTLLPWLPAALLALLAEARIARRQRASLARYGALMTLGMVLLLSLSASKRETYLLPALPMAFLWIGIRAHERCAAHGPARDSASPLQRALAGAQLCLILLLLPLAPLAAWIWLRRAAPERLSALAAPIGAALALASLAIATLLWVARRRPWRLRAAMPAAAVLADALLLALAGPALESTKNLAPFMGAVAQRLPPGNTLAAENADETLQAEVPFYTGRTLLALRRADIAPSTAGPGAGERHPPAAAVLPAWILIQSTGNGQDAPLPDNYHPIMRQSFGPGRSLALWHAAGARER